MLFLYSLDSLFIFLSFYFIGSYIFSSIIPAMENF